jgi:hypothetical protein
MPIACSLEMVEVLNQQQPLFSLGVLERAAKLVGILVRLETCPAEDGAPWLPRSAVLAGSSSSVTVC